MLLYKGSVFRHRHSRQVSIFFFFFMSKNHGNFSYEESFWVSEVIHKYGQVWFHSTKRKQNIVYFSYPGIPPCPKLLPSACYFEIICSGRGLYADCPIISDPSQNHLALRDISRVVKLLCFFENSPGAGGPTSLCDCALLTQELWPHTPPCLPRDAPRMPLPSCTLHFYRSTWPQKHYFQHLFISHL